MSSAPLSPLPSRQTPTSTRRRALGLAGLGLAALGAGLYVAWPRPPAGSATVSVLPDDPLWGLELPRPDGSTLALAALRGQPLIVNFWATWCAPCVHELPLLNQFHQQEPGWTVAGIAVDTPENVQRFIQRFELAFPIGIAGAGGVALARELGNSGGLPFTVVTDTQGTVRERKIGQLSEHDLENWKQLA